MLLKQNPLLLLLLFISFLYFRPGDLLLEAQGKSLEDRSQKDVLHIFKKIKQDKNDKIRIQLVS